ncbi:hypothetical protein [Cronobacter malonaticus]|uniref:hypothetical protein n=1 Tax=Cronobacter malonaticus TaxID=413503 RepID=UPI000CFD51DE|nr:hypothetical protein [Cronobacter malonaticus]
MKDDLAFFSPGYIFDVMYHLFSCKQHQYASRFILSSCEQWLSAELCGLINDKYHEKSNGRFFCYNEDAKRDITFYVCDEYDAPAIKGHAEVKLIYPLHASKRNASINNLIDKLVKCNHSEYPVEGWFFLVWNSYYEDKYSASDFFAIVESDIQDAVSEEYKKINSPSYVIPQMVDFCNSEIKWRGRTISIKVKAIQVTFFSKNFSRYKNDDIESMLLIGRDRHGNKI